MIGLRASRLRRALGGRVGAALRPGGRFTVADRLERLASLRPEAAFLRFEERTLSYGQWNAAANRVAHWAMSEGIGAGDVVALLMENRPEHLILWAGLAKTGATTALLDPKLRGQALRRALHASQAETLLLGAECLPALGAVSRESSRSWNVLVVGEPGGAAPEGHDGYDDLDALLEAMPDDDLPRSLRRGLRTGDDLFIVFTSGASGASEAARLSHLRFLGLGTTLAGLARLQPSDLLYAPLAFHHLGGGLAAVAAGLQGGASLLVRRRFDASRFWEDVCEQGAAVFQYQGELCRALLALPEDPRERQHGLRVALGCGLPAPLWERFRERFAIPEIREFYASTEGPLTLANATGRVGAVGRLPLRPLSPARLIRFDVERGAHPRRADGRCIACAPGEVGELVVRLDERALQEARLEGFTSVQATRRRLLRDVMAPGDLFFRTGDLFQVDDRGWLTFVDPVGDAFSTDGVCVFPRAVEQGLASFPGVELASVYGVAAPGGAGTVCMAALQVDRPARFDTKAFYGHAWACLPAPAVPRFLRLARELPLTASLKACRGALRAEGVDPVAYRDPILVRDDDVGTYFPLGPGGIEGGPDHEAGA